MGVLELLAISVVAGALAGCVFGVVDVLLHSPRNVPTDILFAAALAAPPGAVTSLTLTLVAAVALRALGVTPRRVDWIALLSAATVIALTSAVLTLANTELQNLRGLALLLAGLLAAVVTGAATHRVRALERPGAAIVWGAAAALGLVVAAAAALAMTSRGLPPLAAGVAATLGVAIAAALARFGSKRAPAAGGGLIVLALSVSAVLVWQFGDPAVARPEHMPTRAGQPPNIVLIVLDTTRADHLGAYGGAAGLTPALDEFAAGSLVYEDIYSTSHWTVPSHASMFTGLHPVSHGCSRQQALHLDDEFETLAELLRREGYDTVALYSNIWLAQTNQLQGFDTRVYLDRHYIGLWLLPLAQLLGLPPHWIDKGGSLGAVELARWLDQERRPGRPFFLFINLLEAHSLYLPPRSYRQRFLPAAVGYLEASRLARSFEPGEWQLARRRSDEAEQIIRAMYAAEVRFQDDLLGRILAVLRQATDFEQNLILVTADHGENLQESGRWGHEFAVNDLLLHVPLIVRYPGDAPPTGRLAGLAQITDIMPTILTAIGGETAPEGISHRSLHPADFRPREAITALGTPEYSWLSAVLTRGELSYPALRRFAADKRVFRTGDYKYIWSSDGRHELYAPAGDPLETANLILQQPEAAIELDRRLAQWWDAQPTFQAPDPDAQADEPMSDEVRKQLRALGYIQ